MFRESQNESVSQMIQKNVFEIINLCMRSDRTKSAIINFSSLNEICRQYGVSTDSSEYKNLLRQHDRNGKGNISYFLWADQICQSVPVECFHSCEFEQPQRRKESVRNRHETTPEDDEFSGIPRVPIISDQEAINLISQLVSESVGTAKGAFTKWRGHGDKMTAQDLQKGLAKDGKKVFSLNQIEHIFQTYGGDLNLANFVRLISGTLPGEGSRISNLTSTPNPGVSLTYDQQNLRNLAKQLVGKKWENIIFNSQSNDDLMRKFSRIGVESDMTILKRLTSRYGKTGLIQILEEYMQDL
jgi:Ca2+-binding EF-hand superfamily protein